MRFLYMGEVCTLVLFIKLSGKTMFVCPRIVAHGATARACALIGKFHPETTFSASSAASIILAVFLGVFNHLHLSVV